MGNHSPITQKNRTRLFFKKLLKTCRNKRFFYVKTTRNRYFQRSTYFSLLKSVLKWLRLRISNLIRPVSSIKQLQLFTQSNKQRSVSQPINRPRREIIPTAHASIHQRTATPLFGWYLSLPTIGKYLNSQLVKMAKLLPFSHVSLPSIKLPKLTLPSWKFPALFQTHSRSTREKIKHSTLKRSLKTTIFSRFRALHPQPLHLAFPRFHLRWRLMLPLLVIVLVSIGAYGGYFLVFKDLPTPDQLAQQDQIVTTRILSRDGDVLYRVYEDENRTLVALNDIPQYLRQATIAIEDKNFYYHHGFSVRGIVRAAIANSKGQAIEQGGSTITQQLVKKRLLSSERTIQRKLRELVLAFEVENTFSKDEILEMYLNQVPYGGSTYGIEEAAQRYFGKNVQELSLAESALLAGLPVAPTVYSPFGSTPELSKQRQYEVLRRMVEDEYITQEQAEQAFDEKLNFQNNVTNIEAPHFVMYIRKLLAEQYGETVVNQGGLEVTTTLDLNLQTKAEQLVTEEVNKLTKLNVSNGAALVTNPQTGEILAMVGSKDYFDFAHDGQVNVTLRPRQPGSSIKPLTYSVALSQGMSPHTLIDDSPITYHTAGSPAYSPVNYDGKFHGKVTLRESLASSYNVPAVKTLAAVGVNTVIDQGEAMGIDTWQDRRRFGLSLTLGGGEVTMTDMAELYSTFANYGETVNLNPILEVKNYKGETLYRNTCVLDGVGCSRNRTLDETVAYQITDILSDNKARTPAFGPNSVLHIPNQQVAVKTGTTNNLRDNWTIGYTKDRLVAVWVGNNDNSSMSYVASGITGASPIWNKIIRLTLDPEQPHVFPTPTGMVKVQICVPTGTLPCTGCPQVREELFTVDTVPTQQCSPSWFRPEASPHDPARNSNETYHYLSPSPAASTFRPISPQSSAQPTRNQILEGVSF